MSLTIALTLSVLSLGAAEVPSEGLLAWFDAGDHETLTLRDDLVESWKSKADPPVIAAASGSQRPRYVVHPDGPIRPSVRFDSLDDVLRVPDFGKTAETWTVAAVVAPHFPCHGAICSATPRGGNDYDPGFTVDLFQSATTFDQINVEGAGRIGGQKDQMTRSLAPGGFHVVVVVRGEDSVDLYVDGQLEGSRPVQPATTIMDELRLGARYYAGAERTYFHGDLAQLLLYDRALEPRQRETLEEALQVSETEMREGERAVVAAWEERRRNRMIAPSVVQEWASIAEFTTEKPELDPATLPIRIDIREAVELGVQHLNSLYDRDKDNEPFFFINREADGTGKMRHSVNIGIPHVVGRCLLACMYAERYADVPFPQEGLEILERYLRGSFDNPDRLNSYFDPGRGNQRLVEFHNMREGLYGLWALIAGRQDEWARETAHEMLVTLDRITDEDGLWSPERAKNAGMLDRCLGMAPANAARMIDPLLEYYDCTRDPLAMKLARAYARKGLEVVFEEDGRFAPMDRSSGHVHSITSSLSGITDLAIRTGDDAMLAHCRRIMDVGVPEYFSSWGWGDEVYPEHPADEVGRGEINQTGDVVRTALLLGDAGWPEYYDMAERYVRGMILPTQHREKELQAILRDKPDPADDSERDTVRRSIGGYAMQLPNDRMRAGDWPISTLDITSGAVHALSETYRRRTVLRDGVYSVVLHFDFEDEAVAVECGLPTQGRVGFRAKKDLAGLRVRIPGWVSRDSVRIAVQGAPVPAEWDGAFAVIPPLSAGTEGEVTFDVPCKVEKETVDGTVYVTTWVGNQIVDIRPRGEESSLPF